MIYKHISIFFLVLFVGCGVYSYKGTLPPNINNMSIAAITNNTSEFSFTNILNDDLYEIIIENNIIEIVDSRGADSILEINIDKINDSPEIYSLNDNIYGSINKWKMELFVDVKWVNLIDGTVIVDKKFSKWAIYNTSGLDIKYDGIDNDLDGLLDAEDSDEYGAPRESAIKIIVSKISNQIINELTSTW